MAIIPRRTKNTAKCFSIMRVLSTVKEREELLQRLHGAPNTPEIQAAIRIVEEAIEFAHLRDYIVKMFEAPSGLKTIDQIVSSGYMHHEMRPFAYAVEEIYENTRKQRFKSFYGVGAPATDDDDDKDWQQI